MATRTNFFGGDEAPTPTIVVIDKQKNAIRAYVLAPDSKAIVAPAGKCTKP